MADILPADLPAAPSVDANAAIIAQNGSDVQKGTPLQIVDAARPLASQMEAEAGANNAKIMSPLRVAQAIATQALTPAVLAAPTGSSGIGYSDPIAPSYLKTVSDIINGEDIGVFRFVPVTKRSAITARVNLDDLTSYFLDIVTSAARRVTMIPGLYHIANTLPITQNYFSLCGMFSRNTEIRMVNGTVPAITLANGLGWAKLSGLRISRGGSVQPSAHGIVCLGTCDNIELSDLDIVGHYDNLRLSTCDQNVIRDVYSRMALRDGVYQTNVSSYGASQWNIDGLFVYQNTRDGYRIESTAGAGGIIVNQTRRFGTFANGERGLHVIGGSGRPVYNLDVEGYFGSDNLGAVRLDTYGNSAKLGGRFERTGMDAWGPSLAPASGITAGAIEISANNGVTQFKAASEIDVNGYMGIDHRGGKLIVPAALIRDNGQKLVGGTRAGILSTGGSMIVTGSIIGNTVGNVSQQYGIAANHSNIVEGLNDLSGNTISPMSVGAASNNLIQVGSLPYTHVNRLPNGINVGLPTGGDAATGEINVSSAVKRNGTVYTNP